MGTRSSTLNMDLDGWVGTNRWLGLGLGLRRGNGLHALGIRALRGVGEGNTGDIWMESALAVVALCVKDIPSRTLFFLETKNVRESWQAGQRIGS